LQKKKETNNQGILANLPCAYEWPSKKKNSAMKKDIPRKKETINQETHPVTEKTYLYRALLATIHSQKKIAVATTTSGVIASIMPNGRTAHSYFKIPLTIDNRPVCTFRK